MRDFQIDGWKVGDIVSGHRADYVIQRIINHPERPDWALAFVTRPKGRKIYLALFVQTKQGRWVMADEPVPLPG
ncbi:hypothetical protein [Bellilinea sp.]|uniref:hypothetical protein n=1 Tax=Bellilinea sp. TaxID=2838785 RepID=UPI002ADE2E68|nr:hypothetical protein [Bellilinea sp.]